MSLFIRLQTSFFGSRKTARLRAMIGEAALWLPIRLWVYAAEHQPDGNFSEYTADDLAMLLGYSSNAQAMLEALQGAGFLDGMQVHDWEKHNNFHTTYSHRAKKAAAARWEKERSKEKENNTDTESDREQALLGNATSILPDAVPPKIRCKSRCTLEEAGDFAESLNLPRSDGEASFYKWLGNGWTNKGKPVKDWRATILSWKLNGYLPSQKNGDSGHNGPGNYDKRASLL